MLLDVFKETIKYFEIGFKQFLSIYLLHLNLLCQISLKSVYLFVLSLLCKMYPIPLLLMFPVQVHQKTT